MSVKKDILWRVYLTFFLVMLVGLAIIGQAFRLHTIEGKKWRALADSNATRWVNIESNRGNIYDCKERALIISVPDFDIYFDASADGLTDEIFNNEVDSLAWQLANYFVDHSVNYYLQYLTSARRNNHRYLLIQRGVSLKELKKIKTFPIFRYGKNKGGLIEEERTKRSHPYGNLAHRSLGYVRHGPGSKSVGIEWSFDEYLAGRNGKRLMRKLAGGNWEPVNASNEIESRNGSDVYTTLDIEIQDITHTALLRTLRQNKADHGCAIVMEVATGQIKAMANLGRQEDGSYFEYYNYAIAESTEPGSTFKLASMAAMLEDGVLSLTDSVDIKNGRHLFYGTPMKDSEWHNHGMVSAQKAFELSSNVGISKLADKYYQHEPTKFIERLRELHLDQKTGIEIKGEPQPLIKSPGTHGWSRLSIPWMSVGYEVQMTPLQICAFYNAIANKGQYMKPYIITSIGSYGKPIEQYQPTIVDDQICAPSTIQKLVGLLKGVVENGTARNIRTDQYAIAGKTGTAQIADQNKGYGQRIYQSSFAGFFPADDPAYTIVVVVNGPTAGQYYGSTVAAPVFREIADKLYTTSFSVEMADSEEPLDNGTPVNMAGYQQDGLDILEASGVESAYSRQALWSRTKSSPDNLRLEPINEQQNTVPDVRGMGLRDALPLLENSGLHVEINGNAGKVIRQSITPGTSITSNRKITLYLSS